MKKKILLIVLLSMLCMGAVSAAGLYGTFEGYQIVRVQSNGQTIAAEDVPAVNLNGRTMVPIYMMKELGANVTWDGTTETVNVALPENNNEITNNRAEVTETLLKEYVLIANIYKHLEDIGERLISLDDWYERGVYSMHIVPADPNILYESSHKELVVVSEYINTLEVEMREWIELYPLEKKYFEQINEEYIQAYNNLNEAYAEATEYYNGDNKDGLMNHLELREEAMRLISRSLNTAQEQYNLVIDRIINY